MKFGENNYVICATHRTGSSHLGSLLRDIGLAGVPTTELFVLFSRLQQKYPQDESTKSIIEFVQTHKKKLTTPNGVFGFKIMWPHMFSFLRLLRDETEAGEKRTDLDMLLDYFPNLKFIYLSRDDILAQAVSYVKAEQTEIWAKLNNEEARNATSIEYYSAQEIEQAVKLIIKHNNCWLRFFKRHHIQPLKLYYQDLVIDRDQTIRRVLDYLEISDKVDLNNLHSPLTKQADATNTKWYWQFLADYGYIDYLNAVGQKHYQDSLQRGLTLLQNTCPRMDWGPFDISIAIIRNALQNHARDQVDPLHQENKNLENTLTVTQNQVSTLQQDKQQLEATIAQAQSDSRWIANYVPWRVLISGLIAKSRKKLSRSS